jgi:phosphorylcholine metabolism protein LicD
MILNEFTQLTGYNRSYAARVLRKKKLLGYLVIDDKKMKFVSSDKKRKKSQCYDHNVLLALKRIWQEANYLCSKRLSPFLAEFIPVWSSPGNPDTKLRRFC